MGGTKRTAMPVVVHGGLELQDALLGFFLVDRGGRDSGSSGRVQAVSGGGLQRVKQGLDFRVLGGCGGGKLVKGCTTVFGSRGEVVEVAIKMCHNIFGGKRHGGSSTSRGLGG